MKVTSKTIRGYVNDSTYLFSENSTSSKFDRNLDEYVSKHLSGYTLLPSWDTLRGKEVSHKVVIKGYWWRGSWSDPSKGVVCVYYR